MTKYPNSECETHRSVRTSEPVCVVCMANEIERLRAALQELVDLKDMKEAIGPPLPLSKRMEMDFQYQQRRPAAWRKARMALAGESE